MSKNFEIGVYCHTLKEINPEKYDHITLLEPLLEKYPDLKLSTTTPHPSIDEVTIRAHKGIDLEKECKALLKKGYKVRVALPANLLPALKVPSDVKIDLMAFDYPAEGRTNFHTLLSGEGPCVIKTLKLLPLKQVSLGLATFGVFFKNAAPGMSNTGYGQPCNPETSSLTSADIEKYRQNHPKAKLFYTFIGGCFQSFIYNPETGDWISFDDSQTLKSKTSWARSQGLRGVFFY